MRQRHEGQIRTEKREREAMTASQQSAACNSIHPVASVRHCRVERRISALFCTPVPPSFSPHLFILLRPHLSEV